ncbi:MAG: carbohydrate ABC transporter permease [bacterium]
MLTRFVVKGIAYGLLFLMLVFAVLPIAWVVLSSLKTNEEISPELFKLPREFKFTNLVRVWLEGKFGEALRNSIIVASISLAGMLIPSLMGGYALARLKFRGRNLIFVAWLVGMMLPAQVQLMPLYRVMHLLRVVDTHWALILTYWGSTSFACFAFKTFFEALPREIEEAARIDGCSVFGSLWRIAFPLGRPAMVVVTTFYAVFLWNDFVHPLVFLKDQKLFTLPLKLLLFRWGNWNNPSAVFASLVIGIAPSLALYWLLREDLIRSLTIGAGNMH